MFHLYTPESLAYNDYDIIKCVINYDVVVIASPDALKLHFLNYLFLSPLLHKYDVAKIQENDINESDNHQEKKMGSEKKGEFMRDAASHNWNHASWIGYDVKRANDGK